MKKNLTELVFIIDRSGSMSGLESDTIGGFNSVLEKQKEEEGECIVSTVLFDNYPAVMHDRVPIGSVPPMTKKDYQVRGCTALLDAIGRAIDHIGRLHKHLPQDEVPEHTIFVITTDGLENASREYTLKETRMMIERQKERFNWEFVFLGANIDAIAEARRFGIDEAHAVSFNASHDGVRRSYAAMAAAIRSRRRHGRVSGEWKLEITREER